MQVSDISNNIKFSVVNQLCDMIWFIFVCIIKCGVYDYLHGLWIRMRQHSVGGQECVDECEQPPPQVPVQEIYLHEESGEREPLIGIVNND